MRDLLPELKTWLDQGQPIALATVLSTWGSAPRRAGAVMAVNAEGGVTGSVSGGCVEGAVVEAAQQVLASGEPQRLHFGVANETAWDVGLACGGEIDIYVQPADPVFLQALLPDLEAGKPITLAAPLSGPEAGHLQVVDRTDRRTPGLESEGETETFYNPLLPPPTLVMVGGVHIAVALAKLAKTLGYQTIVVDPRKVFGSQERFPEVDELVQAYPGPAFEEHPLTAATALASLSHDPKIDDPALKAALDSQAFYIGALGSSGTQQKRLERLRAGGYSEEQLRRIHGPIGLEIGAQNPAEIALAIMAEVVAAYHA
jgi:xanthine dehydrogenase accessory factor